MNWIDIKNNLPPNNTVLLVCGLNSENKIRRLRAKYIPRFYMESNGDDFLGDLDYNKFNDEFYWPEGFYEWNEHEDTHWLIDFKITHWMFLPTPPDELIESHINKLV